MDGFQNIVDSLTVALEDVEEMYGGNGTGASTISEIIAQLKAFIKSRIPSPNGWRLTVATSAPLATWVLDMRDQPLELDYFVPVFARIRRSRPPAPTSSVRWRTARRCSTDPL